MDTVKRSKKASRQDWHPADIVAALHKRGITLRKLADRHGITHRALNAALRERRLPAERRIAEAIGIPAQIIWPTRYNADGSRRDVPRGQPSHKSKLNSSARRAAVNGNLREAA